MRPTELPLRDLLAAFRSPAPTPGGGSAAALAGAVGSCLLAMIASMPKHRAPSEVDGRRLHAASRHCTDLSERLAALIDEDAEAYEGVVAAYKLPKESAADTALRSERIQAALRRATDVPLEAMRRCAETVEEAATVAEFGNPQAASDVGVALEMLGAGLRGAKLNVDINLLTVKDDAYAARVRGEAVALESKAERDAEAARAKLAR